MTVYYFARSDVKGGCVFPINGMDMRRIVLRSQKYMRITMP